MKLSKEAMRAARLRAMGLSADESASVGKDCTSDGFKEKKQLTNEFPADAHATSSIQIDPRIWTLLSESGAVIDENMSRWLKQGFSFSSQPEFPLGLKQGSITFSSYLYISLLRIWRAMRSTCCCAGGVTYSMPVSWRECGDRR